jgi:hypothetical protein
MNRFSIICRERRGNRLRTVVPMAKNEVIYDWLYEKIAKIPNFVLDQPGDVTREDMDWWLSQPEVEAFLVDDVGIVVVMHNFIARTAHVHITFWDRILVGREELCRELSRRVFAWYTLLNMYTVIPESSRAVMAFAHRVGFRTVMKKGESLVLVLLPADVGPPNYTV